MAIIKKDVHDSMIKGGDKDIKQKRLRRYADKLKQAPRLHRHRYPKEGIYRCVICGQRKDKS